MKNTVQMKIFCGRCRVRFQENSCLKVENREAVVYLSSFSFCIGCGWEVDPPAKVKQKSDVILDVEFANCMPSREPTSHAADLVRLLREIRDFDSIELLAYGKNSIPLTATLSQHFSAHVINDLTPTVTSFSSEPNKSGTRLRLHCYIRIFEHLIDPYAYLIKSSITKGDLIYIESLDFQRCADEEDFSYLWRERQRYVRPIDYEGKLAGLLALSNTELRIPRTSNSEPIRGQLFEFVGYLARIRTKRHTEEKPIFQSLPGTVKKFQDLIRSTQLKIGIVGLGHKGLTLAHAIYDLGIHDLSLYDDTRSYVSVRDKEYPVYPIRDVKHGLLFSTLDPVLTSRLLPSFQSSNILMYPIALMEVE